MSILRKGWIAAAAVMTMLAGTMGAALAHAALVAAEPAEGAQVEAAPSELRLTFSEPVELAFTKVTVTDANAGEIGVGPLTLGPDDDTVVVVPLTAPLAGGSYTVSWSAVAADGHKSEGEYGFEVRP